MAYDPEKLGLSEDYSALAERVLEAAEQAGQAATAAQARLELVRQTANFVLTEGEIDGITINSDAVERNKAALDQAEFDRDLLAKMAEPLAGEVEEPAQQEEPEVAVTPGDESAIQTDPTPSATRAKKPEGKITETQETANAYVVSILEQNGTILADGTKSAGTVLREMNGVTKKALHGNVLTKLVKLGLLDKKMKNPHFIEKITLKEKLAIALIDSGEFGPEAVKSLESFLKRKVKTDGGTSGLKVKGVPGGHPKSSKTPKKNKLEWTPGRQLKPSQVFHSGGTDLSFSRSEEQHRSLEPSQRSVTFRFSHSAGQPFAARLGIVSFEKVSRELRVLLAVGQSSDSRYSFLDDETKKRDFILKIVNKGVPESKRVGDYELDGLIAEIIGNGHLGFNGNGLELTDAGFEQINKDPNLAKSDFLR